MTVFLLNLVVQCKLRCSASTIQTSMFPRYPHLVLHHRFNYRYASCGRIVLNDWLVSLFWHHLLFNIQSALDLKIFFIFLFCCQISSQYFIVRKLDVGSEYDGVITIIQSSVIELAVSLRCQLCSFWRNQYKAKKASAISLSCCLIKPQEGLSTQWDPWLWLLFLWAWSLQLHFNIMYHQPECCREQHWIHFSDKLLQTRLPAGHAP